MRDALADLGQMTNREDAEKSLTILAAYEKTAKEMARTAEIERTLGISLLRTTTDEFNQMMDGLQAWRSHIDSAAAAFMATATRDNARQRLISWAVVAAVNLSALLLVYISSRGITRPLRRLETRMIALTEGDPGKRYLRQGFDATRSDAWPDQSMYSRPMRRRRGDLQAAVE